MGQSRLGPIFSYKVTKQLNWTVFLQRSGNIGDQNYETLHNLFSSVEAQVDYRQILETLSIDLYIDASGKGWTTLTTEELSFSQLREILWP